VWPLVFVVKVALGLSDPFVIVKVNEATAKTDVVKKTLAPEWRKLLTFPFNSPVISEEVL